MYTYRVEMLARRPDNGEREVISKAELTPEDGLKGDRWANGSRSLKRQITIMNYRVATAVTDKPWLSGDQVYADMPLFDLAPGDLLLIGRSAVLEISTSPHVSCRKFSDAFGSEAKAFIDSRPHLRGLLAKVVWPGTVRIGDGIARILPAGVPSGSQDLAERRSSGRSIIILSLPETGGARDKRRGKI